jgi:succinate-acetate transporter protein
VAVGDRPSATACTSQPSANSLRTNLAVLWVFITLIATYLLLVLAELGVASSSLLPIAGYVGITCGVAAWYVAFAHVTNAAFGRYPIPTRPLA